MMHTSTVQKQAQILTHANDVMLCLELIRQSPMGKKTTNKQTKKKNNENNAE
jgi:hypothetical protein